MSSAAAPKFAFTPFIHFILTAKTTSTITDYFIFEHQTGPPLPFPPEWLQEIHQHLQQTQPLWPKTWQNNAAQTPWFRWHGNPPQIQATHYIGSLRIQDVQIHFLPKLFYQSQYAAQNPPKDYVQAVYAHIQWWLQYSAPKYIPQRIQAQKSPVNHWLELFVQHFATYTQHLLQQLPYQAYSTQNQTLKFWRGQLRLPQYFQAYTQGKAHQLPMRFSQMSQNNLVYRILKYTVHLLLRQVQQPQTRQALQKILRQLTQIPLQPHRAQDCSKLVLPPLFAPWQTVLDYCQLFLSGSHAFQIGQGIQVFALLLPMHQLFEQFIYNFVRHKFPQYQVTAQPQHFAFDHNQTQYIYPDLLLKQAHRRSLIDLKYKTLKSSQSPKRADLYQMLSYGLNTGIQHLQLWYPAAHYIQKTLLVHRASSPPQAIDIVHLPIHYPPDTLLHKPPTHSYFLDLENQLEQALRQTIF